MYAALHVRTVPGVFEILSGSVSVSQLREVAIEDLLRRQPVETDHKAVREIVQGTTVLVTGGRLDRLRAVPPAETIRAGRTVDARS